MFALLKIGFGGERAAMNEEIGLNADGHGAQANQGASSDATAERSSHATHILAAMAGSHAKADSEANSLPLVYFLPSQLQRESRNTTHVYQDTKWIRRLIVLLVNLSLLIVAFCAYAMRLNLTYQGATFIATLGLDHRIGWLEIGAFGSLATSIIIHLQNSKWRILRTPTRNELGAMQTDILCWTLLEIALAGLIQDSLLMATNRLGTLLFFQTLFDSLVEFITQGGGIFFANRLVGICRDKCEKDIAVGVT